MNSKNCLGIADIGFDSCGSNEPNCIHVWRCQALRLGQLQPHETVQLETTGIQRMFGFSVHIDNKEVSEQFTQLLNSANNGNSAERQR